jgi:hypothetical protein
MLESSMSDGMRPSLLIEIESSSVEMLRNLSFELIEIVEETCDQA